MTTADRATSFEAFYEAHFQRLIVQLYAHTGDMSQAQDVVQEAFARALPRWQKLAAYDDPAAWVRRVAWNLATSRWRQLRTFTAFARRHREESVTGPTPDRVNLSEEQPGIRTLWDPNRSNNYLSLPLTRAN